MKIPMKEARQCLRKFDFQTLFREHLGWDNYQGRLDITLNDAPFVLTGVAEKRGFVAFTCPSIPDRATRLKLDHQITKSAREHFVIYCDRDQGQQLWHWVRREPGKPLASRDHRFDVQKSGEALLQRLEQIAVSIEEEAGITVVDVAGRARAAFDVEKTTKRFYDRFKNEHAAFMKLIQGVTGDAELQWYASLMLNRLMFVYFIQKKGFLDNDVHYLRNRLEKVQALHGSDKFLSFYRYFLLRLFHDGLGKAPEERRLDAELEALLGQVPFLNGGFFEVHQLESQFPDIDIPDKAFEKLFDFFDQYAWHLDERPLRNDNEINPDVVGYIFEKYINQKQMGAYYTKEDITEYISKNTVIPFLFDEAKKRCAVAFEPDSALWRLLRDDPDRYLYPAVKHGVVKGDGQLIPESELPDFVRAGMHDPKARMHDKRYNLQQAPADDPIRLVTETWREYVARRNRCLEIREQLGQGEVTEINTLITLNLDIWQFARDTIVNAEGPDLLRVFWCAVEKVSVLDPTCGSGAFLFAALRILETLYSDCLERMRRFIDDLDDKPHHPKQYADFKTALEQIATHPNERYFILKTIILNNLYGVDIMDEAVEICKLRLFLKLVAQVETVDQIEPLPDMDFNIRAGNTLVGYVSLEQMRKAAESDTESLANFNVWAAHIQEEAEEADRAFQMFHILQTKHDMNAAEFADAKVDVRCRLDKLRDELDLYLAKEYGIRVENPVRFNKWHSSHRPFHWLVEFFGVMKSGGFNVIIGNPPWKEYTTVKKNYIVRGYETEACGNLHCLCSERSLSLRTTGGWASFIVQLPLACSSRMEPMRRTLRTKSSQLFVLTFDDRPGKLFDGLQHCRSVIFLSCGKTNGLASLCVTRYQRWYAKARSYLFENMQLVNTDSLNASASIFPKFATDTHVKLFSKIQRQESLPLATYVISYPSETFVFYQEATQYWVKAAYGLPYYSKNGEDGAPAHGRYLFSTSEEMAHCLCAILNSSLFYIYFITFGDCFHLNDTLAKNFPVTKEIAESDGLEKANRLLVMELRKNAERKSITTRDGAKITYDEYIAGHSKSIIDMIDQQISKHFGFTDDELDFIINYDIKYRLGSQVEIGNEDEV